jgi:hypothetical protein
VYWVLETFSVVVKQPGHEADNSLPSGAEVKNAWIYTSTPAYIFNDVVHSYAQDAFS